MRSKAISMALAMLIFVNHAQAADGAAQLVNRFASLIAQDAKEDSEYASDGKLTLKAAKKIMQGRTTYDLSVYVYLIADRGDEINWAAGASAALDAQIRTCRNATQNSRFGSRQIQAQQRELSGDAQTVAAQSALLFRREASLDSQASYECRGIEEALELRGSRANTAADPLKD